MTLLISGAGGQLGRRTAALVLERHPATEVVLLTRDPGALQEFTARGAQVRYCDFDDTACLADAFAGAERMLLISTDALGRRIAQHRAAIDAAVRAGVRHVAYTSVVNPTPDNPAAPVSDHAGTEEALRSSGLEWTLLRMNLYSESFLPPNVEAAVAGRLIHNAGSGKVAHVSREDLAAAACAVLVGEGHEGVAYDITGPEAVTRADIAAFLSDVTEQHVDEIAMDDGEYVDHLVDYGLPPLLGAWVGDLRGVAEAVATFGQAIRKGAFERVSTDVEQLTGRPPRTVRDVLSQHRDEL